MILAENEHMEDLKKKEKKRRLDRKRGERDIYMKKNPSIIVSLFFRGGLVRRPMSLLGASKDGTQMKKSDNVRMNPFSLRRD